DNVCPAPTSKRSTAPASSRFPNYASAAKPRSCPDQKLGPSEQLGRWPAVVVHRQTLIHLRPAPLQHEDSGQCREGILRQAGYVAALPPTVRPRPAQRAHLLRISRPSKRCRTSNSFPCDHHYP